MVNKTISQFLKKSFGEGKKQKEIKLPKIPIEAIEKFRELKMDRSIIEVPNTFQNPEQAIRSSLYHSHPNLRSQGRPNITKARRIFFQ